MKKRIILFIFMLLLFFSISSTCFAAQDSKTILLVLDDLDFRQIEKLYDYNFSIGIMNIKTRNSYNEESFFMSISTGRRVDINQGEFKGLIKRDDGSIKINGYDNILGTLNRDYKNFSDQINFLGQELKKDGISYIGQDESSLLAADKNGIIQNGELNIVYDKKWLSEKTNVALKNSDVLVVSYEIDKNNEKLSILKDYIDKFSKYNIILFPRRVSSNKKININNSLVPIIYKNSYNENGILTSDSTKRDGVIINLDVLPQILSTYQINNKVNIGKNFKIIPTKDALKTIKDIFKKIVNLTWITYICHGIVYLIQLYFTYFFIRNRKNSYKNIVFYFNFIIIGLFISLLMGLFNFHRSVLIYMVLLIIPTYIISDVLTKRRINVSGVFSTLTYILMLVGIFFYPRLIYNSYIGYDNLIGGQRFYGFNNGAMGILLSTSIISYFTIKKYIGNKILNKLILLIYFSLNIIALSVRFGANTGGFFTSIVLFLMMIYVVLLNKKLTIKNIIILSCVGILILFINFYIDLNSVRKSHAGSLICRIKVLGVRELFDIVKLKLKQLILMALSLPWVIVLVSQIIFLKKFWQRNKSNMFSLKLIRPNIDKEYIILIITGLIAFMLNDTGVIAFIYMIQYLLVLLVNITIGQEV